MLQGLNVPEASEAKVACNQIRFLIVVSSAHGLKNIKRVCIKCKPGFKNPKALSTEVMPSDRGDVIGGAASACKRMFNS